MKNTEKYVNIERAMSSNSGTDMYTGKVTDKQHEATTYLEQGFEWLGIKDNLISLRNVNE